MFKEKGLAQSLRLMFSSGVAFGLGVAALPVLAQEQQQLQQQAQPQQQEPPPQVMQRVEVTGSSIKRIAAEGALPVTVVTAEAIRASGVTSMADLVQRMSTVQGSTGESASVGGSTFGFAGISVHGIGEARTLVLLNGKRLAMFGGQTLTGFAAGFDLNSIPISAIDRVELLTDGASALYGADAIAGVVNFITKRDRTDADITIGYSHPEDGARERRFSLTKGFGSLEDDGWNVMLTFGHDERTKLSSNDRGFANTGQRTFSQNGKQYRIQQFSASPIPANVLDDRGQLISPFQRTNGNCPEKTFRVIQPYTLGGENFVDDYCGYDFVKDLEIFPERKRDNLMLSATTKAFGQELYADVLLSQSKQSSRIAPVPGQIGIDAGTPLHTQYLAPIGITGDSVAFYRLFDMGQRTSNDIAQFASAVFGSRGSYAGWDYDASYNYSKSKVKGNIAGYPGALAVANLADSGLLNPFVGPGQQTAAAQDAIRRATYSGYWDGGTSELNSVSLSGSRELMQLAGGALQLGVGINYNREEFSSKPGLFAQGALADPVAGTLCGGTTGLECDQRFGDPASSLPYTAKRNSQGVFAELVAPVIKNLELGAAARYDHYSDFGSAWTGKASFKWSPTTNFLVRGSVGNGFHAPTVPQVNAVLQGYGVTSEPYLCTPALQAVATANGAVCRPGSAQYDVLAGGNRDLQPEKSRQATLGFRYEPFRALTLGLDIWTVAIRDVFGQLTEQVVFADPQRYASSWGSLVDIATGRNYVAFRADNQNLGKSYFTGIDYDITARHRTPYGQWTSQLNISQMLRDRNQLEENGEYYSATGNFAELGGVTFRNRGTWRNTLKTGDFSNTLIVNFKSGYRDQATTVDVLDAGGNVTGQEDVRLKVGSFATFDWQTVWTPNRTWSVTGGILNLTDKDPPFVPSTSGANRGQQFGYDDRYYDARGRTLYVNASYRF
jgi:iron complex outermembrane receptor protein